MLQRIEAALRACTASDAGRAAVASLLASFPSGPELLHLSDLLDGCRVRKQGALLFSDV
jgi:hypothetical protein